MNKEEFEDILEFARSDIRKGYDRFEVLQHYVDEAYIYFDMYKKSLSKYVKRGSEYKIVEHLPKDFIAEICKQKIQKYEEPERFKKIFERYCKNDIEVLSDADVDYARNIPVAELLEGMTDIKIKRRASNCPFCDGNSEQKFHCKNNLFQCFKCGKKGDSIGFYMMLTGNNFVQTVKEMRKW